MQENDVKVGDVVVWGRVPEVALVKDADGWHALRLRGRGIYVGEPGADWLSANPWSDDGRWLWNNGGDGNPVTIIALGLTGQESAADLQRLAEVYEVREALRVWAPADWQRFLGSVTGGGSIAAWAERLHAAGWRRGMTAEDAARLLAEAR